MGRLIPAGTGLAKYKNIGIQIEAPEGMLVPEEDPLGELAADESAASDTPPTTTDSPAPESLPT
jgi:hypothetical protein